MGACLSLFSCYQKENLRTTEHNSSSIPQSDMATPGEPPAEYRESTLKEASKIASSPSTTLQLEMVMLGEPEKPLVEHEKVASTEPSKLPSQVEETLAVCPKFRIVLVGNTGVGKSSLVSAVFNFELPNKEGDTAIDIAHDRAGEADINYEHRSKENPRFILHDSMGFEPGSTTKSNIVKKFLQERAQGSAPLPDQVHAIWLCIETPRTGSRLLQTGDEDLLKVAKELNIPVIVVFTKYDQLIMEHYRACSHILRQPDRFAEATTRAKKALEEVTKEFTNAPFVPVSTKEPSKGTMLLELTKKTKDHLRDVEGSLWVLWATAQQVNARQKVEHSIREGCKKYWRDLGQSVVFEGQMLGHCIDRIHDDILKVWNFNDPDKLLSRREFLQEMLELVEPVRNVQVIRAPEPANQVVDRSANMVTIATAVGSGLILPALGINMAVMAYQFLNSNYQKGASTGKYLAAYIVDLILVLHTLSVLVTATADPPRKLSTELVMDALATYKHMCPEIHTKLLKENPLFTKVEERIEKVIQDSLPM